MSNHDQRDESIWLFSQVGAVHTFTAAHHDVVHSTKKTETDKMFQY